MRRRLAIYRFRSADFGLGCSSSAAETDKDNDEEDDGARGYDGAVIEQPENEIGEATRQKCDNECGGDHRGSGTTLRGRLAMGSWAMTSLRPCSTVVNFVFASIDRSA